MIHSLCCKSGFDPSDNVRFRHSGGLAVVKDASFARAGQPVLRILDNGDPLAKLAAKR
jgi:hypothetical protein